VERLCTLHRGAQEAVVGFLYCSSAGYGERRASLADGGDALTDEIIGSVDAANRVVNLSRTIDGDDGIVEEGRDIVGSLKQKETCRQEGETDILFAKEVAEGGKVGVQQRLATGEDDVSNAEVE
jgi:hypothetical protein